MGVMSSIRSMKVVCQPNPDRPARHGETGREPMYWPSLIIGGMKCTIHAGYSTVLSEEFCVLFSASPVLLKAAECIEDPCKACQGVCNTEREFVPCRQWKDWKRLQDAVVLATRDREEVFRGQSESV